MNIERSLSQVSMEGLQHSDFSGAMCVGGRGALSVQHFLSKKWVRKRAVQSKMIFPISMSWINADFSRGNKIFFSLSSCSISSIWHLLLLVSPSNMWKMFSTMQSRWLGHHLLSHHSVLCIPADAFQNQRTILLGATEKRSTMKEKNGPTYATTQILLWLVPHWQPAWYRAFPGTPSQDLKAGENLRGCGRPRDWQTRPAFCSVLRFNTLGSCSVAERKRESIAKIWAPWDGASNASVN